MSYDSESVADVSPRSILITGGGSGIGAALARRLAERGRHVVVSGRRRDPLDDVAVSSEFISVCPGDVTDPAHRSALVAALAETPGPRAVVHTAGSFRSGFLDGLSMEEWRRSFATNVEARWALSCESAPLLSGGRILFVGSDAGANPRRGAGAYSIAQAASETLRRCLQVEWADSPIVVGAFRPGLVDTDMVRGFMQLSPEEFPARSDYEEYVASGRIASASTIARFASWLLLDVEPRRFGETDWDVRDTAHHPEWSDGPLYPQRVDADSTPDPDRPDTP